MAKKLAVRSTGILMYDVPTGQVQLYSFLRQKIRHFALPINKSVCLCDWAHEITIKQLLETIKQKFPNVPGLDIRFLKQDSASDEELYVMAYEALGRLITRVGTSLRKRVAKVEKELKEPTADVGVLYEKHKSAYVRAKYELNVADGLALIFGLTQEVDSIRKATKAILEAEMAASAAKKPVPVPEAKA